MYMLIKWPWVGISTPLVIDRLSWQKLVSLCVDSDFNFERKLFTEVNNEVGSRVILSEALLQSEFFLKPVESPPSGHQKEQCKGT